MRVSGSPGKLAARITTALSALASRLTAVLARSLSLQTCAAVNATKRPKMIPSGGNIPGEMALNERARSPPRRGCQTPGVPHGRPPVWHAGRTGEGSRRSKRMGLDLTPQQYLEMLTEEYNECRRWRCHYSLPAR
jgi:hypothetical protein